jgi:hypothetical protein
MCWRHYDCTFASCTGEASLLTVVWTIAVADLWVRFLIVAVKAVVAAVPLPLVCCKGITAAAAAATARGYSPISTAPAGTSSGGNAVDLEQGGSQGGEAAVAAAHASAVALSANARKVRVNTYRLITIARLLK